MKQHSLFLLFCCHVGFGFDLRTGGGGIGEYGYPIFANHSGDCPLLDGTLTTHTCEGITPFHDMKLGQSSLSLLRDNLVFEVVLINSPFHDIGFVTSFSPATLQVLFLIVNSNEYNSCEDFITSAYATNFCQSHHVGISDCLAGPGCLVRHSTPSEQMYDSCAGQCNLPLVREVQLIEAKRRSHTKVKWDFEDGLEGWANSSSTEMEAEIYTMGGELRGTVTGTRAEGRYVQSHSHKHTHTHTMPSNITNASYTIHQTL
jgi:hypothetical protein